MPPEQQLSIGLLVLLVPLVLFIAQSKPLYWLLVLDIVLVMFPGEWHVGLHIDPSDVVFFGLAFAFFGLRRRPEKLALPSRNLWIALGIFMSISYFVAPQNQDSLTDPARIAYQLYRYGWKPILYFAVAASLLRDDKAFRAVLLAIVVVADLCSIQAAMQGFQGLDAAGPFSQKNTLAGFLVIPMLLAIAGLTQPGTRREKQFHLVSVLLMGRGLVSAGSRGALVAMVAGALFYFGLLTVSVWGRTRAMRMLGAALGAAIVLFALKPDVLERPNVKYLLEATKPDDVANYQWRKEERWPFFYNKMVANPLFGVGTDVDYSLGESCATPHNGYLAVGVRYGIPALFLTFFFVVQTLRSGLALYRRGRDERMRIFGLTVAAGMVMLLVHSWVEATIITHETGMMFWILAGATAVRDPRRVMARSPRQPASVTEAAPTFEPMAARLGRDPSPAR